ncbi:MAG: DUF2628 domain-containing protein [Beijerinckiaceae bacterium]
MASYTIHIPPSAGQSDSAAERFRLVRDGLSPWAMLLWPVWFFAKRLWLGAMVVYGVWIALNVGLYWAGVAAPVIALSWAAFLLLIGLEAHSVERWTLARRGWQEAGIAVAGNRAEAEERAVMAFTQLPAWPVTPLAAGRYASVPVAPRGMTSSAVSQPPDVLGLFPEAQHR